MFNLIMIIMQIVVICAVYSLKEDMKKMSLDPKAQQISAVNKNFPFNDPDSREKRTELIKQIIGNSK